MLDDIRTYARMLLAASEQPGPITGRALTRAEYVAMVRMYAIEKHGEGAQLMAERTARHAWDSRR